MTPGDLFVTHKHHDLSYRKDFFIKAIAHDLQGTFTLLIVVFGVMEIKHGVQNVPNIGNIT